jgi:triosephosphate isomerase (TIM)
MRQRIVAGNWKMNKTLNEAMDMAVGLTQFQDEFPSGVKVILAPPALYLANLEMMETLSCSLAAQNCSHHDYGAFTGEISPAMLHAMNIDYCIIGHSERRQYFGETDHMLQMKADACLRNKVKPIFCIGEQLAERQANKHFEVVANQLKNGIFHLPKDQFAQVIIAYEPVWAIGTGVTASNEQAEEMHAFIRQTISLAYNKEVADGISILYGGSVNAQNSAELFACPNVDGGLVGGASLKAKDFATIIVSAA